MADEALIAVFIDFENLALGVRDAERENFRIDLVLKRLLEKGRVVFKRAYCDWSRYRSAVRDFHSHGIAMVDIPQSKMSGKNSADIHMVVDALDLCYAKDHIDVFALLSGDSDFSPLVSKLKENNKRVIGCGVKSSSSHLLIDGCDEFIYYDDLIRSADKPAPAPRRSKASANKAAASASAAPSASASAEASDKGPGKRGEAMAKLVQIIRSLERDYDPVWGSMVKQTIRRVHPGFNEEYYGYPSFVAMLEDARDQDYIDLEYDEKRGNYIVRLQPSE